MLADTFSQPPSSYGETGAGRVRAGAWRVGLLALGCALTLALFAGDALAGQLPVSLGAASSYAALAGSTVTSTGPTTLNGDLGVWPGTSLTGFPPGRVTGTVHAGDPVAMHAQGDLTAAYNDAASRQPPQALPADVGGRTLAPGVYKTGATPALGLTGTLTLDGQGDPNAVFVIRVGSALTTAVTSHVNLIGRAQPGNVFWQIGSSATLGTSSTFAGSILALTSISIDSGVTLNGRALARNGAVTLINDTITVPTQAPTPTPTPTPSPTPGPSHRPPVGGGRTGFCATSHMPAGSAGRRPPARPLLLSPRARARVRPGLVKFRWRPAARAARYALMVDRRRMSTGCATRASVRVGAGSHSYRVIAENRYGTRSSRRRAFAATKGPSADEIRRGLGLDALGKTVVADAERITLQAAEAGALRSALRLVGKFATKAGVLGFLISIGLDNGDLSCEQGPLYVRAKPTFALTANVLGLVSRAHAGPNRPLFTKINDARSALNKLKTFILRDNKVVSECEGPNKVALATITKLYPALTAASTHLTALAKHSNKPKKKKPTRTQPTPQECMAAIKALTKYASTFEKVKHRPLDPRTKEKLDKKRNDGTITSADLPGGLTFPGGPLKGKNLNKIREICKSVK